MAHLFIGAFLPTWIAVACLVFNRKHHWIIATGGGFLAACVLLVLVTVPVKLIQGSPLLPATFHFAIDQFKYLTFWLATDLVLFIVYPRFLGFLSILPLIGAVAGYLIFMPVFHATLLVYGILIGFGVTENHSVVGAGIFVLIITFCLAYWAAVDNVRSGNYGMR